MKDFISTAATIYLIGCPILTTIFMMLGWCGISYNKREDETKMELIIEFIAVLYLAWWWVLKALATGNYDD